MLPPVPNTSPVDSKDMADVDTVLRQAVIAGNPLIAAQYGNDLIASIRLRGVALAKFFYGLKSNWPLFQAAGIEEGFVDFVDAHINFDARTADKYADMYAEVLENDEIPLHIREQLKLKPIQTLLLLTAAVREGDLGVDDLENVVVLDHGGVHRMVREARGDVTNSRTAVYARLVTEENRSHPPGSVIVYGTDDDGNMEVESLGMFKMEPETESGRRFLARAIRKLNLEGANHAE